MNISLAYSPNPSASDAFVLGRSVCGTYKGRESVRGDQGAASTTAVCDFIMERSRSRPADIEAFLICTLWRREEHKLELLAVMLAT